MTREHRWVIQAIFIVVALGLVFIALATTQPVSGMGSDSTTLEGYGYARTSQK